MLQIQPFHWRLSSITEIKTVIMSSYSYFLFVYFFTLILRMYLYIQQYHPSFYISYKNYFSRVRHLSHPGRGHGSLTCDMTQVERSDWLRSENFINIMIQLTINISLSTTAIPVVVCDVAYSISHVNNDAVLCFIEVILWVPSRYMLFMHLYAWTPLHWPKHSAELILTNTKKVTIAMPHWNQQNVV